MKAEDRYVPALRWHVLTPAYDAIVGLTTRERLFKLRLLEDADLKPGAQVLDLGCGTGTLAIWAKERQPEAAIIGLDGDPRILAIAERKARRHGARIEFREGLSDRLPFPEGTFDRVLSSLFFHHLAPHQKAATLREVRRVLRPGGELHIADWGAPTHAFFRGLFLVIQALDGFSNTRDHVNGAFPAFLVQAGFEQVEIRGRVHTVYGAIELLSARAPGPGTR